MIDVEGLGFRYAGRIRPALRDVTFHLERGESLLVLGPSGCGKSTLALGLNGAIPHFVDGDLTGSARVAGASTRVTSMAELAQRVGLVFQDPESQFCMLKVDEEVAFGLENLAVPRDQMRPRILQALASVGLAEREHDRIEELSGGQKQRLALACVLAQRAEVLIFDEPTAQLDPAGAADVIDLIAGLRVRGEHTLIIIEHRLDELMHLVDKVLVLSSDGDVVAFGPARAVLSEWCEWLTNMGVWVPQVSELAIRLRSCGVHLNPFPMTVREAAASLEPYARPLQGQSSSVRAPTSSHASLIQTRALSYLFPQSRRLAVDSVSIEIRQGELTAVAGANGAGKSTLARHLVGILRPPLGSVWIDGQDAFDLPTDQLTRLVGYVFQYPEHQFVGTTLLDDVAFGLRRAAVDRAEAERGAKAMLSRFGLESLAPASPFTLSHGEQRRLSVASMLVLGQRVLLLDEPTFGQDRRNYDQLLAELERLAREDKAIVAITHDMRLVAEHADRVLAMADGQVIFDGRPADLFADQRLLTLARLVPPPLWRLSQALGLVEPLLLTTQFVDAITAAVRQPVSSL